MNDECVYIGSGNSRRAFDCTNRNNQWITTTGAGTTVKIIVWLDSLDEARRVEKELIRYYQPSCNIAETPKKFAIMSAALTAAWQRRVNRESNHAQAVRRSDGVVFRSMREAAKSIKRSPSALTLALQKGNKTGGYYFERIERARTV